MEDELFSILTSLANGGVRFLVVGGVAVVLHGHPRFTADLDLVIDLESTNAKRVFSLWSPDAPGTEVDLFVEAPFDFAAAFDRADFVTLGGASVPLLRLADLTAMKRAVGRPKDLADVEALEEIAALRARGTR